MHTPAASITIAEISPVSMMWALVLLIISSAVTIIVRQLNAERDLQRSRADATQAKLDQERLDRNDDRHSQILNSLGKVSRSVEQMSESMHSVRSDLHDMRKDQESLREEVDGRFGQVEHRLGKVELKVGGKA